MRREPPYGAAYRRERARILSDNPVCAYCGSPATEADHVPPLARHTHVKLGTCCRLVPSCSSCARMQSMILREGGTSREPGVVMTAPAEPDGVPQTDQRWRVPWLRDLLDVPPDATWPRLMTLPHPRAVGSLGAEFVAAAALRADGELRWSQRLVATRLLEVDDAGLLVWDEVIVTMARQCGKSWLLRELALWRMQQAERFGEPQTVMHVANDLTVCREIQRPAKPWARLRPDLYAIREGNGREQFEYLPDGSRWLIRAKDGVYGYSVSLALVDEGWKIALATVDDAITPTMVEREQPQLILFSTAHRKATSLMRSRRHVALHQLAAPAGGPLLIEWSAPRTADLDDVAAWRAASPHWTPRREKLIRSRLDAALNGEVEPDEPDPVEGFRAQWLNQWPQQMTKAGEGEELVPADAWGAMLDNDAEAASGVVFGIEDHEGRGVAAAAAGVTPDGRYVVGGWLFDTRHEAFEWVRGLATPDARVIVGPALRVDAGAVADVVADVIVATGPRTRAGLAAFRSCADAGELVHDGSYDLTDQLVRVRVAVQTSGLALVPGQRADLIRATCWALDACREPAVIGAVL